MFTLVRALMLLIFAFETLTHSFIHRKVSKNLLFSLNGAESRLSPNACEGLPSCKKASAGQTSVLEAEWRRAFVEC
jgi:hypothetical protein